MASGGGGGDDDEEEEAVDYERLREERVKRNRLMMQELQVTAAAQTLASRAANEQKLQADNIAAKIARAATAKRRSVPVRAARARRVSYAEGVDSDGSNGGDNSGDDSNGAIAAGKKSKRKGSDDEFEPVDDEHDDDEGGDAEEAKDDEAEEEDDAATRDERKKSMRSSRQKRQAAKAKGTGKSSIFFPDSDDDDVHNGDDEESQMAAAIAASLAEVEHEALQQALAMSMTDANNSNKNNNINTDTRQPQSEDVAQQASTSAPQPDRSAVTPRQRALQQVAAVQETQDADAQDKHTDVTAIAKRPEVNGRAPKRRKGRGRALEPASDADVVNYFKVIDENNRGYVTAKDIDRLARAYGFGGEWTEQNMKDMIDAFDIDGDGRITLVEFQELHARHGVVPGRVQQ
eukprot:jgi/Chlat1/2344/Chrsp17S02805